METKITTGRPSRWHDGIVVVASAGALSLIIAAVVMSVNARRPVGEGELFRQEAEFASGFLSDKTDVVHVKSLRNELQVEAVSLVDAQGEVVASSSPGFVGSPLSSPFLTRMIDAGRFGAIAAPLRVPLTIDGVIEWEAGETVYDVVQPLPNGLSVVLTYDLGELLARRSARGAIPDGVVEMLAFGGFLGLGALASGVGRARVHRSFREFQFESEFLTREAETLRMHNEELNEARVVAEDARLLAEDKNRIRSEFVLMINHELRTPLTSVVTGAELLREQGLVGDPLLRDVLEDVHSGGVRLQEMIGQMLAVARIENRALFFELQEIPCDVLVERVRQQASSFDVSMAVPCRGRVVRTDPTSVVGLIQALVDNAYSHGAESVTVSLTTDRPHVDHELAAAPSDAVYLLVTDDGPGIDPRFLPRVFEKFEKQSSSSGTGLGLYIASHIVSALEGSIGVASSPAGTTMVVSLPVVSLGDPA